MSYNRYRKRDKSEINRKSEIGLGRVENYDSADISENVIHHVRDYLYTPLYLDIDHDRPGSYGVVKFLESGHTMFITTLCRASGESRVIYDTLCGSLVYDKPSDETDVSRCPINFNILGNYTTSPIFIDSTITVTIYKEQLVPGGPSQIVTYVGIGMDGLSPFRTHEVRSIGTNLHDYSLGSVDYINTVDAYDQINTGFLAQWTFRISDQIRRERLAVPLYSKILGDYIYAREGSNYQSGEFDVATINEVPFCGVYDLTIDGQDARHITVPAKHRGDSREDAGIHQWEVLGSYPYLKYSESNRKYQTFNSLSQENSLSDKGGLCYLSDFDDSEGQSMDDFLGTLGYWLSADKKEENLSVSSVITVGILRRFWSILKPLLNTSDKSLEARIAALESWRNTANGKISDINANLATLQRSIDALSDKIDGIEITPITPVPDPVIPEPEIEEPTEARRYINLSTSKGRLGFSSPVGIVTDTVILTGTLYQEMSNGDINTLGNTSTLMYLWEYDDAPIKIQIGNTTVSDYDYKEVGELAGFRSITITLTDPVNTPTFSGRELTLYTKDTDDRVAQTIIYISYTNGNVITHGALIDSKYTNVFLDTDGTSTAAYYPIGSTVNLYLTAEELAESGGKVTAYINQVVSNNGTFEKDSPYFVISKPGADITELRENGQVIYKFQSYEITMGVSDKTETFYLSDNNWKTFMTLVFHIQAPTPYLNLNYTSVTFGPSSNYSQSIEVYSNYPVYFTNNYDWITCEKNYERGYLISVLENNSSNQRTGAVIFINEAGSQKTLNVIQTSSEKYIKAFIEGSSSELKPGSSRIITYDTPNDVEFKFYVESNIGFDVFLDRADHSEPYRSYASSSGSKTEIKIPLSGNQTTSNVTHLIEISSELKTITFSILMRGPEDEPVLHVGDNIFHKGDAFDILRTEKILTVSCRLPDRVELLSVSDDDLVAKIYGVSSDGKALIHCYPKTVKVWNTNKTVTLKIKYGDHILSQDFVIEATTETVGSYFNVSSTIESFRRSDTISKTIEITGFSMSGTLELKTNDKRSSLLVISDPQAITGHSKKWTVTIPKGAAPISGTPWTLALTNTVGNGSYVKYINIYEASDVAWDTTGSSDFQITAFGHSCIADGCEIMPIVYERRYMKSYIGTNDSPNSTSERIFPVICTVHDLSRVSLRTTNTYWSLSNSGDGLLRYSTCDNLGKIDEDQHNAITVTLDGVKECPFSSSMDTNFYNNLGLEYEDVYGSECIKYDIAVDQEDESKSLPYRYVLLPNSLTTVNHICMELPDPIKYTTNNSSPNFLPVPPDWKITSSGTTSVSRDGYLKLFSSDKSFTYAVDSRTNWGTTQTCLDGGKFSIKFCRSDIKVIDQDPDVPEGVETIIYDQQNPRNDGPLEWSGLTFTTMVSPGSDYQPVGSRYYFNSSGVISQYGILTNNNLNGIPSGAKVVTDLNLTLNCANIGKGFNDNGTGSGYYSKIAFASAKMYDLENSKIWESQETFPGWDNLHNKNRLATFLTDGIGSSPLWVKSTGEIKVYVGIAGICEPSANDRASTLMYVPYVKVSSNSGSPLGSYSCNYLLVKYGQRFGLGFQGAEAKDLQTLVECKYQLTRTIVDSSSNGYYKYNVKISSNSGITASNNAMTILTSGSPNLLLDESTGMYTYRTSGTLDFEITHDDFCNIISNYASRFGLTRTDSINDETPWYFYGVKSGIDHQTMFYVQRYSYLRDLKVTVK